MIQTKRLYIYPLSNTQMTHLIAAQTIPELKAAYSEMLRGCVENPDRREWYAVWNIELKDPRGVFVGAMAFKGPGDNGIPEIGYGINDGFENHGYMTEAVLAIVEWAAAQEGVKAVEAEAEAENLASRRVLEKTGFVETGKPGKEGPRFIRAI